MFRNCSSGTVSIPPRYPAVNLTFVNNIVSWPYPPDDFNGPWVAIANNYDNVQPTISNAANNYYLDPQFVGTPTTIDNARLSPTSPMRGLAIPLQEETLDYEGRLRPAAPTIGK